MEVKHRERLEEETPFNRPRDPRKKGLSVSARVARKDTFIGTR